MKVVIIGGVAGGMSAATRLRRLNEDAEIIILEKGPYVSFANCGLPYYVAGEIKDREDLLVQTPKSLKARFNLDVRPFSEATSIDADKKEITVKTGDDDYVLTYDKLIMSPGARPFIPPAEGLSEASNVFTLRSVPDVDAITEFIDAQSPKHAVVIGAGFIGLEMAESLAHRGLSVTIIEKAPHVLPPLDEEMAAYVAKELVNNGVVLKTSLSATAFKDAGRIVVLEDGSTVMSDLTIMSVGVLPETRLAKAAGIELGMRGAIVVDENYETNLKDIYAVGDAIVVKQTSTQMDAIIALASPANRQGRQVADVISGISRKNKGSLGTAIVRVFGVTAASTGLTERQLGQLGKTYKCVHVLGKNHAGYYPGAEDIILKLIFNPISGELYGAQAVGADGVDKRIDILATAIKAKLTVEDLPELEFTYAPPFGSAKDPVNMAGYAALNIMEGYSKNIQWYELEEKLNEGYILLDVRDDSELNEDGRFETAIHIPIDQLRDRLDELDQNKSYIVSCKSGLRSYIAERLLTQQGFNVINLDGSFSLYATVKENMVVKTNV